MKFDVIIQNEENNFLSYIKNAIAKKPQNIYILCGSIKESGYDILEEYLLDISSKIYMYIGIDKKNTTKNMLVKMLDATKNIYYYDNNNDVEFDSNMYIFEYANEVIIYSSSSSISEGAYNNKSIISETILDDKKEFKVILKNLINNLNLDFIKLFKKDIQDLVIDKKIFSNKQYIHNVKSISDYLGKEEIKIPNSNEDITIENMPKIDFDKLDLDIDISNFKDSNIVEEIEEKKENKIIKKEEKNIEEDKQINCDAVDIDSLILSKSNLNLNKVFDEVEEEQEKDSTISKKIDLNKVSNYIFEIYEKSKSSNDNNIIKIPNYIKTTIPLFFNIKESKNINGISSKVKNINLEIIDVEKNITNIDNEAKFVMKKGQTYFTLNSYKLSDLEYSLKDIIRLIKIDENNYQLEVISKSMQEHKIWSKITTQKFKSVDRKYGFM